MDGAVGRGSGFTGAVLPPIDGAVGRGSRTTGLLPIEGAVGRG
jgi:hypothetical protein